MIKKFQKNKSLLTSTLQAISLLAIAVTICLSATPSNAQTSTPTPTPIANPTPGVEATPTPKPIPMPEPTFKVTDADGDWNAVPISSTSFRTAEFAQYAVPGRDAWCVSAGTYPAGEYCPWYYSGDRAYDCYYRFPTGWHFVGNISFYTDAAHTNVPISDGAPRTKLLVPYNLRQAPTLAGTWSQK